MPQKGRTAGISIYNRIICPERSGNDGGVHHGVVLHPTTGCHHDAVAGADRLTPIRSMFSISIGGRLAFAWGSRGRSRRPIRPGGSRSQLPHAPSACLIADAKGSRLQVPSGHSCAGTAIQSPPNAANFYIIGFNSPISICLSPCLYLSRLISFCRFFKNAPACAPSICV